MSGEFWLPFPQIQPEETLFGWSVAYSRVAAVPEPREVSRRLCGHPTAILRHDFPCRLDELCHRVENQFGTAEELIERHTLLPFYSPFLARETYEAAVAAMRTGRRLHLRALLGLSSARMGVDAPLKACPECMADDVKTRHRAIWHRDHQWPTTFLCFRHGIRLWIARPEFHLSRQLPLLAPNELSEDDWIAEVDHEDQLVRSGLDLLNRWTRAFVSQEPCRLLGPALREAYALGARELGWLALDGSIRMRALRGAFAERYRTLTHIPALGFLARTGGPNCGFLGNLLRQYEGLHHPARHIALAAFLFPDWASFEAAHRLSADRLAGIDCEAFAPRRATLRSVIGRIQSGESVNSVAQSIGVPITQLIRLAAGNDIPYQKRPRIVGTETEDELIVMLRRGCSRAAIVKRLGVRPAFIKDYLAARPNLRDEWEAQNFERRRLARRLRFQRTLTRNPGVPIKRIRQMPGNGFQWLYKNDRDWLEEQLPAIWRQRGSGS